jgi:ankyrin repeat protein
MNKEFFEAIKQGNLEKVQRLLSISTTLIHEKEDCLSPIMVAAYRQKIKVMEFICEKTVNLDIFESAAAGKVNSIARHLARDPLLANAYACDGFQPLGLACLLGQYEAAEYLMKAGAVINAPSRNLLNATPIQSAVSGGHSQIVELLLKHNANPNVRESKGFTPLHTAAQNGNAQIIRALLYNGADISLHSHQGDLPIDLAMAGGHTDAAALLKEGITRRFKAFRLPPEKN